MTAFKVTNDKTTPPVQHEALTERTDLQRINHAIDVLRQVEAVGLTDPNVTERNVFIHASLLRGGLENMSISMQHFESGHPLVGTYYATSARELFMLSESGGSGRNEIERAALKIVKEASVKLKKAHEKKPLISGADGNLAEMLEYLDQAALKACEACQILGFE